MKNHIPSRAFMETCQTTIEEGKIIILQHIVKRAVSSKTTSTKSIYYRKNCSCSSSSCLSSITGLLMFAKCEEWSYDRVKNKHKRKLFVPEKKKKA